MDGPCWPKNSLASFFAGSILPAPSSAASAMETSSSVGADLYPYEVGIIAFGVSSPAYPARREDVPMSTTRAETSSEWC